mmetsp:Transcript_73593/g.207205  ORF Transcript_73593/g.207205 Transcript_73593/m.207205 type:complete len:534 (+) Transcript_73593:104-1705(+)
MVALSTAALRHSLSNTSVGGTSEGRFCGAGSEGSGTPMAAQASEPLRHRVPLAGGDLGDISTSRPGSSSGEGGAAGAAAGLRPVSSSSSQRKHSMTRLPDEGVLAGQRKSSTGGQSSLTSPSSRPDTGNGQQRSAGLVPLGDFGGPGSGSASSAAAAAPASRPSSSCGSAANPGHASLTRLPDDATPAAVAEGLARPAPLPLTLPGMRGGASSGGGRTATKLRDRMNKNLSVAVQLPTNSCRHQVFRQLAEGETINDLYDFGEEIYSAGSKGKVLTAVRRSDNCEVVVKIRTRSSNRTGERAWREIMDQVYKIGGTSHVLDLTEIVEGQNEFYVVMPKCQGGELFDFLATEAEVPEAECKRIICEILTAVGHLHKNNIIHRDIKPENIMFDVDRMLASPKTVRLIDFDTCLEWSPATPKSKRFVGTPGYIAPEALMGELSPQSDLWAVGVIFYILMTGEMPWSSLASLEDGVVGSPGARRMYDALKAEVLAWDEQPWPEFPLARDLCQKLLAFSTEERLSNVEEAMAHAWLQS